MIGGGEQSRCRGRLVWVVGYRPKGLFCLLISTKASFSEFRYNSLNLVVLRRTVRIDSNSPFRKIPYAG